MSGNRWLLKCFTLLAATLFASSAAAEQCTAIFPGGIQSHSPTGVISMGYESRVYGGGSKLVAPTVTHTDNPSPDPHKQSGYCGANEVSAVKCLASGTFAAKSIVSMLTEVEFPSAFEKSSGVSGNLSNGYRAGTLTRGTGDYGTVTVGQESTIRFSANAPGSTYRMRTTKTNYLSTLEFEAGSYWIDGDLDLREQGSKLRRIGSGTGPVIIYVNGNVNAGQITLENFATGQILLYSTGNVSFGNSLIFPGRIHARGSVSFGTNAVIAGGVYGSSLLSANSATIRYTRAGHDHVLGTLPDSGDRWNATYEFAPGNYYFSGNLNLSTDTKFRKLPGTTGKVRIFVNGNIKVGYATKFEGFGAGELLMYSTGNVDISSQSHMPVFVYAAQDVTISFSNNARFRGGISARNITVGQGTIVEYATPTDLGPACTDQPSLPSVHHYHLDYSSTALSCGSLSVTIKACANADCSLTLSTPSTLTLSPSGGWNSNPITFTGSTTATLAVRSPGEVTLGLSSASPAASNGLVCSTSGCKVKFLDSGFLVEVPDFISGDSTTVSIQAVKADKADPQECSPAFDSGTRTLSFWSSYEDPDEEVQVGNQSVSIDGATIGKTSVKATPIDIAFSPNATAQLSSLTYPDAGEMALHVSYSGAGDEEGLSMKSMEGQGGFIVTPAHLKVEARTIDGQPVICSDPEGDFDTDDCRKFVAAGDEFSLYVTALNRVGNETANFQYDGITVEVVPTDIHPGGGAAVLSPASYVHGLNNENTFSSEPMVDEVGVVRFRATAENYLKEDNQVVGTSDWVGRFFPAWLELGVKPRQNVGCLLPSSETPEIRGFTYQGQPTFLTDGLEVQGFNRSGVPTQNYKGAFWRFTGTLEPAEREGATIYEFHQNSAIPVAGQPSAIADRVTPPPVFTATPAEAAFLPSGGGYSYARPGTPSALDNLFSLKMVIWDWHDQDKVYFKNDVQPESEWGAETDNVPVTVDIENSEFRLGRIRTENVIHTGLGVSPVTVDVPLFLEHWVGGRFETAADGCTNIESAVESHTGNIISPGVVKQVFFSSDPQVEMVQLGVSGPEDNLNGTVSIKHLFTKGLTESPYWLCQERVPVHGGICTYSRNEDKTISEVRADATATFGIYKGPKPLIFRRELYRGM